MTPDIAPVLAAHRVLVARDRIAGVRGWEELAIGSPLLDDAGHRAPRT